MGQQQGDISESRLVYEVMQELGKHGAVYRCNSGSVRTSGGKRFRAMPEGFSDVMLIMPGSVVCFVECKVKPNKPSGKQLEFIEKMRGLGCRAGVAYDIADAMSICGLANRQD
jgi:hypothetical protein